jgi:hypothetical protein
VVRDGHKLGQHRSAEDGVVGGSEVCDLEHWVHREEVVFFNERD